MKDETYRAATTFFDELRDGAPTSRWDEVLRLDSEAGRRCRSRALEWRAESGPILDIRRSKVLFLTGGSLQATLRFEVAHPDRRSNASIVLEEAADGRMRVVRCEFVPQVGE